MTIKTFYYCIETGWKSLSLKQGIKSCWGYVVSCEKQPDDKLVLSHFDLYLCEKSKTNFSSKPGDLNSLKPGPIQLKFHVETPSG